MERKVSSNILVYGGSFNPPTLAHEAIIRAGLMLSGFDELWVMPSGKRRDKNIKTSNQDRLNMLRLVRQAEFADNPRLKISNFELALPIPTQTSRTVRALKEVYPNNKFCFMFGTDAYESMHKWEGGDRLKQELDMVLISRGHVLPTPRPGVVVLFINDCPPISSTMVREAHTAKLPLGNLVSSVVAKYILERRLYEDEIGGTQIDRRQS